MNLAYADPFLTAAVLTFDTMLGCRLEPREAFIKNGYQTEYDVSAVIGLSSEKAKGTVILSLSQEAAVSATEAMLGERPAKIDGDVADAVGELANIIAGAAKAQLERLALSLSLPTIIIGKQHAVEFPHKVTPICIPFDCPWGCVGMEVAVVEEPQEAAEP